MSQECFEIKCDQLSYTARENIENLLPLDKIHCFYAISLKDIISELLKVYDDKIDENEFKNCLSDEDNKNNEYFFIRRMRENYFFIVKQNICLDDILVGIYEDYKERFKDKDFAYENTSNSILEKSIRQNILTKQMNKIEKEKSKLKTKI